MSLDQKAIQRETKIHEGKSVLKKKRKGIEMVTSGTPNRKPLLAFNPTDQLCFPIKSIHPLSQKEKHLQRPIL